MTAAIVTTDVHAVTLNNHSAHHSMHCLRKLLAISLEKLLTTKNSDDLEMRVSDGQGHWKLHRWIPRVSFPISYWYCTWGRIVYRLWDIAFDGSQIALLATRLALNAPTEELPCDDLVKFCTEVRQWPRYTAVKKYCQTTDRRICDSKHPNVT